MFAEIAFTGTTLIYLYPVIKDVSRKDMTPITPLLNLENVCQCTFRLFIGNNGLYSYCFAYNSSVRQQIL